MEEKFIAIILIRSNINVRREIKQTLDLLKLKKKNSCVIYKNTPVMIGMAKRVKDFVTWGELDDATAAEIKAEHGKLLSLHPPIKGFERKGIKIPFSVGGALGYRGDKINGLLKRMFN